MKDFDFFSTMYLTLMKAAQGDQPELPHVMYNAHHGFTLQYILLLAPLTSADRKETAFQKIRIVSQYVDIVITWRIWNAHRITYNTMQHAIFRTMKQIRGKAPEDLATILYKKLKEEQENFRAGSRDQSALGPTLHSQNRRALHRILARLTDYVETQSGIDSQYKNYVRERTGNRYEIEHIWPNDFESVSTLFSDPNDFAIHRNRLGALVLLPKRSNASYGALSYEEKLPHYIKENLLARSLHHQCYDHNPGFLRFIRDKNLPFKPYRSFDKQAFRERTELYTQIAEQIWNPENLLSELDG